MASLTTAASFAQSSPRLETLFPNQAPIEAEAGVLTRVPLPPEVVAECRPDLSDLRVFDGAGREVPFLIDTARSLEESLHVSETFRPRVLDVKESEMRPETGPSTRREQYRLQPPPAGTAGTVWSLGLEGGPSRFVLRVEVTALLRDGGEEPLVTAGSVWRLPRGREHLELTLPELPEATAALLVQLEGEQDGYVNPRFQLVSRRRLDSRLRSEIPLTILGFRHEGSKTLVDVDRPRGLHLDRLRLSTSTDSYHRAIEVWDAGPGRQDEVLGQDEVLRLPALVPVVDDEFPIGPATGDRLRLVIENGDSPPLHDLELFAVTSSPHLLVTLPAGGAQGALLRFGGGRAFRPHYDLAGLTTGLPATGHEANLVLSYRDPARFARGRLGEISRNPLFDPTPALAFAHRAGADLATSSFSHRRTLVANPSAEGLNRMDLGLADLAVARPDLADLRIVNGEARQWAYLLDTRAAFTDLELEVGEPSTEAGRSRYPLTLPASPATMTRLTLESDIPYFDRSYTLMGWFDGEERRLAAGRLVRRIGDPRPLTLRFSTSRIDRLELEIEDGDDARLDFSSAIGRFPVPRVYFAAPAGPYVLLLGDGEASAPQYELERVRDVVLAVEGGPVAAGVLEGNPDQGVVSRWSAAEWQRILLWLVLVGAVLVLAGMVFRLAKAGP